jgi:hypothetical protein
VRDPMLSPEGRPFGTGPFVHVFQKVPPFGTGSLFSYSRKIPLVACCSQEVSLPPDRNLRDTQKLATADQPDMPESAIASGCIDFILSPEDIAREIIRIAHASEARGT